MSLPKSKEKDNTKKSILLTNPEIIQFYENNKNINPEIINLFFIDIIKKLSNNLSSTLNDNNITKILDMVSSMNSNVENLTSVVSLKIMELKKDYVDDVKGLLNNSRLSNQEQFQEVLNRNQDNLINKTTLLLNNYLPKSQEGYSKLENIMTAHFDVIKENTVKLLQEKDEDAVNNESLLFDNIDKQFNKMNILLQKPICDFVQSSEERTVANLQQIKDQMNSQKQTQDNLAVEMNEFLNKYKNNSSSKGNVSETELYFILQKICPSDEIIRCSTETASCDFKVNRHDSSKPCILFENKNYARTVDSEEIKKFERDVCIQKKHGIFLSQSSPITFKTNFHIDIINGLILVYVPNAEYDFNKIKIAIDIIDHMSVQLKKMVIHEKEEGSRTITFDELNNIVKEYNDFGRKRMEMIDMIKSMSKQMLDKMEDIQLPQLNSYLLGTGQYKNEKLGCSFCNNFNGKNKSSLAAHMRNCKSNPNCIKKEGKKEGKL